MAGLIRKAGLQRLANLSHINKALFMPPGIINVSGYFRYFQLCQRYSTGHGLIVNNSIYCHETAPTSFNQACHRVNIFVQKIRRRKRRIDPPKSSTIFLMAIAAVLKVELLPFHKVLLKLRVSGTAANDQAEPTKQKERSPRKVFRASYCVLRIPTHVPCEVF